MALETGTKLGAFEITGLLGKGGMGEVYRARDSKLGRDVAIKVLSPTLTDDAEMLVRFEREALNLAALDHPAIGALHEFGHDNDTHFLVMQLVEGDTLADRIARGPLPIDEAVRIFSQVAEGLDAAHARGIVHRDLKPANIKVTADDRVKILDFGIAKSVAEQAGERVTTPTPAQPVDPSAPTRPMSPTPSTFQTGEGTFIGTPQYMSPEQARGKPVDRRADVWAFGVCFYQALTGRLPFDGETFSDVIAAVLRGAPDWNALPAGTPAYVRELLRDCLERDKRFRLRDMGQAWVDLNRPRTSTAQPQQVETKREVTRFFLSLPPHHYLSPTVSPVAIAPDGSAIVCALFSESRMHLYIRRMDALEFEVIVGTENARTPFFSPDGKWIGYSQNRSIRIAPLRGGTSRTLVECESPPFGAVWTPGDVIVWGELNKGLQKVRTDGTERAVLTTLNPDKGELWQLCFSNVGDTGRILANVFVDPTSATGRLESVSVATGDRRRLRDDPHPAWRVDGSHLVATRGHELYVQHMSEDGLQVSGEPVRVLKNIATDDDGKPLVDVSASGSLVYSPKESQSQHAKLYWVNRRGAREEIPVPPNTYFAPKVSPDGETLAVVAADRAGNRQVHLLDSRRGVLEKITDEPRSALTPAWHPDGNRIAYSYPVENLNFRMREIALDSHQIRDLGSDDCRGFVGDYSRDGSYLTFGRNVSLIDYSIHVLDESGQDEIFVEAAGRNSCPRFHPSGDYIAYISNESGRWEVYARPFHRPGRRIQVSLDGGSDPVWARDGSELFYRNGNTMFSVRVEADNGLRFGPPEALFDFDFGGKVSPFVPSFDVHPDGERFVMCDRVAGDRGADSLIVVRNWIDEVVARHLELKRK